VECLKEKPKTRAELIEELKTEWKLLWKERFDDKVSAEGIANRDYSSLFVEKGTVIFATRNFKLLSLKEVLEEHGIDDAYRFFSPIPGVGGWGKFIRASVLLGRQNKGSRAVQHSVEKKRLQQLRKGGRGWLHV
jgi:hypothetical protein